MNNFRIGIGLNMSWPTYDRPTINPSMDHSCNKFMKQTETEVQCSAKFLQKKQASLGHIMTLTTAQENQKFLLSFF